ncbi:hypothetical protein H2204_011555 [Knufia peltigerae]|uniref:ABM domain-containing protein n=1 Tax=Knufia peltigerae TaxID=1002370 RepID=A0AA39CTX7_9EURO|nr:hypothetical protein H2204_011555 [Knufia peltigerae]
MATASGHVQETRNLVPIAQFIESKSENGILMTIEMFIDPSKLGEYVKIVTPVCKKMREYEDCMFCEVSCHPEDKGHVRILHGWTKDSAWIRDGLFNTLIAYRQLESDSQLQKDLVAGGWRHCSLKSTEHEVYNDGGCLENGRKRAV